MYTTRRMLAGAAGAVLLVVMALFMTFNSPASATNGHHNTTTTTAVADPESGVMIEAKAIDDHECDSTERHWVITSVVDEAHAPIKVLANLDSLDGNSVISMDVPLSGFTGGVAHYRTTENLQNHLLGTFTIIYPSWVDGNGQFNLSHGPCDEVPPTTVPPTTAPPTTAPPTTVPPTTAPPTTVPTTVTTLPVTTTTVPTTVTTVTTLPTTTTTVPQTTTTLPEQPTTTVERPTTTVTSPTTTRPEQPTTTTVPETTVDNPPVEYVTYCIDNVTQDVRVGTDYLDAKVMYPGPCVPAKVDDLLPITGSAAIKLFVIAIFLIGVGVVIALSARSRQ